MIRLVRLLAILTLATSTLALALESRTPEANRDAIQVALQEIARAQGVWDAAFVHERLQKAEKLGFLPGPLCYEFVPDQIECRTRNELQRDRSLYRQTAQSRGVADEVLVEIDQLKEILERAYAAAYQRNHPLPPEATEGDVTVTYLWAVDGDGELVQMIQRNRLE